MKTLKLNLIITIAVVAMLVSIPMLQAQDKETHKKSSEEKVAIKNFFNILGDMVATEGEISETEGHKLAADLVRSLGYIAEESEGDRNARDFFLSIGDIIEAGENTELSKKQVAKMMRGLGKFAADDGGNKSAIKIFDLIARAVESDSFNDKDLEKAFVKDLFNTLGDIVTEVEDDIEVHISSKEK